jgi:hypothetical protein
MPNTTSSTTIIVFIIISITITITTTTTTTTTTAITTTETNRLSFRGLDGFADRRRQAAFRHYNCCGAKICSPENLATYIIRDR